VIANGYKILVKGYVSKTFNKKTTPKHLTNHCFGVDKEKTKKNLCAIIF